MAKFMATKNLIRDARSEVLTSSGLAILSALVAGVVTYLLIPLTPLTLSPVESGAISVFVATIIGQLGFTAAFYQQSKRSSDLFKILYDDNYQNATLIKFENGDSALRYILGRKGDIKFVCNTRFSSRSERQRSKDQVISDQVYVSYNNAIKELVVSSAVWKDVITLNNLSDFADFFALSRLTNNRYSLKVVDTAPRMNFIILSYSDGGEEVIFNWDFVKDNKPKPILVRDPEVVGSFRSHFNTLWDDYPTIVHADNEPSVYASDYTYSTKLFHFRTRTRAIQYLVSKLRQIATDAAEDQRASQLQEVRNVNFTTPETERRLTSIGEQELMQLYDAILGWLRDPNHSYIEVHGRSNISRLKHLESRNISRDLKFLVNEMPDSSYPMLNYVTLSFKDGVKVVMFGWGMLEGYESGEIFVSDNPEICRYFDHHFMLLRKLAQPAVHVCDAIERLCPSEPTVPSES